MKLTLFLSNNVQLKYLTDIPTETFGKSKQNLSHNEADFFFKQQRPIKSIWLIFPQKLSGNPN